jgi:predicted Ser/Thr protein kinase
MVGRFLPFGNPASANKSSASSKGDSNSAIYAMAGAGALAGTLGLMMNQGVAKAKIKQLQINLRLQQEKRANVQQLGQIDIADQMGLALSNRLQGALQMGGSNSEVYAQEGRNMNFSLRSQLHDMLVQEVQTQNEIYSAQFAKKAQMWQDFASIGEGGQKAILAAAGGGGGG